MLSSRALINMVVLLRCSNAPFEKAEVIEIETSQKTSRGRNILSVHIQVESFLNL